MERRIGEQFDYNGVTLEVVKQPLENNDVGKYCNGCYFNKGYYCCYKGECCYGSRSDSTSVIFKKVEK